MDSLVSKRWILTQRIAFIAYRLFSYQNETNGNEEFEVNYKKILLKELNNLPKDFFYSCPLSTLHILSMLKANFLGKNFKNFQTNWEKILNFYQTTSEGIKAINATQTFVLQILNGIGSTFSILHLGKELLSYQYTNKCWKQLICPEAIYDIDPSIEILRNPSSHLYNKFKAILSLKKSFEQFSNNNPRFLSSWNIIENVFYHYLLSWPLILDIQQNDNGIAMSLPIAIDVYFNNSKKNTCGYKILLGTSNSINISNWTDCIQKSIEVAKILWHTSYTNHKPFQPLIENATILFNFTIADKIVCDLPTNILLQEKSLETYCSQIILSRFLGNKSAITTVTTGSIGKQHKKRQCEKYAKDFLVDGTLYIANFDFDSVSGILEKLKYVFTTKLFDRIILPKTSYDTQIITDFLNKHENIQSAEIIPAGSLQNVSDIVQVCQWRPKKYIRCSDIAILMNKKKNSYFDNDNINQYMNLLKNNDSSVIELDGIDHLRGIVDALCYIDNIKIKDIPKNKRPTISWTFVRVIPTEMDEHFWYVLWKSIGAPLNDFHTFISSPTSQIAVKYLTKVLNSFSPNTDHLSHCAPDIIVILGAKRFSSNPEQSLDSFFRRLSLKAILDELKKNNTLKTRSDSKQIQKIFGETRLIILYEDTDFLTINNHTKLNPNEDNIFKKLSVFRFDFTLQMAKAVLYDSITPIKGHELREILLNLCKKGYLYYWQGKYFIPGQLSKDPDILLKNPRSKRNLNADLIEQHFIAATVYTPYMVLEKKLTGLIYEEAFLPENIHLAEYHLLCAYKLSLHLDYKNSELTKITSMLIKIQFFSAYALHAIYTINNLSLSISTNAYELTTQYLKSLRQFKCYIHPLILIPIIKTIKLYFNDITHNENSYKLIYKIKNLYREAYKIIKDKNFLHDNYTKLKVIAEYSIFLFEENNQSDLKELEELNQEICELLREENGEKIDANWYLFMGNNIKNHCDSHPFYLVGIQWHFKYSQLIIITLGNTWLIYKNQSSEEIRIILDTIKLENLKNLKKFHIALNYLLQYKKKSKNKFEKEILKCNSINRKVVLQRWNKGLLILERFFNSNDDFIELIKNLKILD